MNKLHPIIIGCFIISAAHYMRNGADFWYAGWIFVAIALHFADRYTTAGDQVTSQHHGKGD